MLINAIAPWFGGKRTLAPTIVEQLGKHSYYFECCAGSMSVLLAKEPSEHEVVCDLHGALTNLAWVVQDGVAAATLYERLQRVLYSDALYQQSKEWLAEYESGKEIKLTPGLQKVCKGDEERVAIIDFAYHYFIASWMGRNGVSGTARVNYQIATRWTKGGGSGPGRFRAAVESIPEWHDRIRNVHILRRSMFDVLPKLQDDPGLAIYADPPYLLDTVAGNSRYMCDFAEADHRLMAEQMHRFKLARIVVSYYAHPTLKDLYPGWTWLDCSRQKHLHVQNKRGMGHKEAPEVLLINGPAFEGVGERPMSAELFV